MLLFIKSRAVLPILNAAAQWELDGPRITGPITSLKMLTGVVMFGLIVFEDFLVEPRFV